MGRALPVVPSRVALLERAPARPAGWGEGGVTLEDARGRRITYLRISVTDRCTMACVYCMPPGGETEHALRSELLTFEEIVAIARALVRGGVRRVRLTGGEPLARKDIVALVAMLRSEAGVAELALTTNGARLSSLAGPLRRAGLGTVNVSIDSLDPERFAAITRGGVLGEVIAGIDAALEAGLEVKLNCVALGGINDDELGAIVDWAWARGIVPRFIELMPIGEAARLPRERFLDATAILARLGERVSSEEAAPTPGRGPARYVRARDGSARSVGLITAVSDAFCDGCNRVRLSSRGELRACLADRRAVSLRDLLRRGGGELDLLWAAAWSLGAKAASHRFVDPAADEHHHVGMSLIGG